MERIEGKLAEIDQEPCCIVTNILLYPGDMNRRTRGLTIVELRKLLKDCRAQINAMGPGNVPLEYRQILTELKKVIKNREETLKAKVSLLPY